MNLRKNKLVYYGSKVLIFIASVFVLSLLVFYISRLAPGDPLLSYYGDRVEKMSVEEKDRARERLGLNEPIYIQYGKWIKNAFHGDFGISYKYKQDVMEVISLRIKNTLILGGIGYILIFILALALGIICAWNEDKWIDKILCKLGTISCCIPEFWYALVLILVFCVELRWLPSSGAYSIGMASDIKDRIIHLILPMAVVLLNHPWYYGYIVRNKLLDEMRADYVLLSKSKGQSKSRIMFAHCLRNIITSYISIMAISVPHVLGGTYIVETVFAYPGVGTLAYESARFADYNMLMILCIMTGVLVIFCNILGQIINERIDPRIKANDVLESSEVSAI